MKDEQRIFLAFLISILILVWFSARTPRQQPDRVPPARQSIPASNEPLPSPVTAFGESRPVAALTNDLCDVAIDASGAVQMWGLKKYLRPGEERFVISKDAHLLADTLGGETVAHPYRFTREGDSLVFVREVSPGKRISKRLSLTAEDGYTLECEIEFVNEGKEEWTVPGFRVVAGAVGLPVSRRDDEHHLEVLFGAGNGFHSRSPERFQPGGPLPAGDAPWVAGKSRYALVFLESARPESRPFSLRTDDLAVYGLLTDVKVPAGQREKVVFSCYGGPADMSVAGAHVRHEVFGSGPFATAGRIIFSILAVVHRVVPNWGVAIILLTLLIKAVLFPLTYGGLRSMRQLQMLRPYLKDIQTKYKDNPQQMQQELMKLYRDYKINPFGGCLPMLAQMPVFVGFFLALRGAVDLRGAPFCLWMKDLSLPDTIWRLPASLPGIGGFPVNVLPLLMTATAFVQQKVTPQQDPSQKMLVVMMPLMFLFLFYNFSSGLLLYWVTMNIAGIAEQWLVSRTPSRKRRRSSG